MFTPHIIRLEQIDSTNSEARRHLADAPEGTIWTARFQSAGHGQYNRHWNSSCGENILATLLLRPTFLPVNQQFYISKCTALGICSFFEAFQLQARIKWPNDIYVGSNKICGILIEHQISSNELVSSIIGFGININQTKFEGVPNPTSLFLETGQTNAPDLLLPIVIQNIQKWYQVLHQGDHAAIDCQYDALLLNIPASAESESSRNT